MIGILGGTFDPIHHGHLRPALDVQQALELDELRLIPLRDPPHRRQPSTTPKQRLEMVQAAINGVPGLSVDRRELERAGKSYTLLTLQSLREELGETPICLILGQDAFTGFAQWHRPEEILQLAHLVVMQRPGESGQNPYPERLTEEPDDLRSNPDGKIYLQPVTQLDISSTRIRAMLQAGQSPSYLLPAAVLTIIDRDGLYRP
ncbi:MAG: nicotinate-nucleotide adenylyltransferase [Gammaproteobacteria bacterium]|nr:nicotinate-nucleotide adenylyltransferase [Gammaproteobacteria bacterium]